MYSYGPPHMDVQKQDDQLELTYSNYVRTQDVTLKTCLRRWMIGRSSERGSGISVLVAQHDDDDDDDEWSVIVCIYSYIIMIVSLELRKIMCQMHRWSKWHCLSGQEHAPFYDFNCVQQRQTLAAVTFKVYIYKFISTESTMIGHFKYILNLELKSKEHFKSGISNLIVIFLS